MSELLVGLKPVVDEDSAILVLGSFPGPESLRLRQYYAKRSNQFWRIIYAIFGKQPAQTYADRIAFLAARDIALWTSSRAAGATGHRTETYLTRN
jgi:TDG/mug DNA glycosylase family protein